MPMTPNNNPKSEFLIELYKARVQLHSEHTNRMWTRFNFILTAEIALLAVFFSSNYDPRGDLLTLPTLGCIVSFLWYILGAQDHFYFEGFRKQVQSMEQVIAKESKIPSSKVSLFGHVKDVKWNPVTWRSRFLSLSKLTAVFPLLFLALWLVIFFLLN